MVQTILCLLILPDELNKPWAECTDEYLLMNGQMYWCSLRNALDAAQKNRVPVEIPKSQLVDSHTLNVLMDRVAEGEVL